jgi:hypothetical protein
MIYDKQALPQHKQDAETTGLKTVAGMLETQLSVLFFKRTHIQQEIYKYRIRFNEDLGEIVNEILDIRRKLLFDEKDINPDKNDEYEDAEKDYQEFTSNYKQSKKEFQFYLSEEDKKLLQKLFRKASKLCHPDIVAEEMKDLAQKVFVELNNAYFKNDLDKIKDICSQLENQELKFIHITEKLTENQRLNQIVKKLENDIKELKKEIFELEHSDAYLTIKELDNWDLHFEKIHNKLFSDLENLRQEYAAR